jgi:iron(II)-dependent oxidoreductase
MNKKGRSGFALTTILVLAMIFVFYTFAEKKMNSGKDINIYVQPELVLIRGGEFAMGKKIPEPEKGGKKQYVNNPVHQVYVDSFYMDKYEVTNYQYYLFCKETGRKLPVFWGMKEFRCGLDFPNHPVVGVSYWDAHDYAQWKKMRLPTEAEWEYGARGGLTGKKYPHGDELHTRWFNYSRHMKGTTQVGNYPANGYGLHDMIGNVREWVSDYYHTHYYLKSPNKNPRGPEIGRFKVIRGGSWYSGPGCVTVYRRNALASNWVDFAVGFRCARDFKSKKGDDKMMEEGDVPEN